MLKSLNITIDHQGELAIAALDAYVVDLTGYVAGNALADFEGKETGQLPTGSTATL